MTVSDRLLASYLPGKPEAEIALLDKSGAFLRRLSPIQAQVLAERGLAEGEIDKRGRLKYCRALKSVGTINKAIGLRNSRTTQIAAEDNRTVFKVNTPTGILYQHNLARSFAYASPRHRQ